MLFLTAGQLFKMFNSRNGIQSLPKSYWYINTLCKKYSKVEESYFIMKSVIYSLGKTSIDNPSPNFAYFSHWYQIGLALSVRYIAWWVFCVSSLVESVRKCEPWSLYQGWCYWKSLKKYNFCLIGFFKSMQAVKS